MSPASDATIVMNASAANPALARWHTLRAPAAAREILPCCGSRVWASQLAAERPLSSMDELCAASDRVWAGLSEEDWQQAFDSHPRIGQQHARSATAASLAWSAQEQASVTSAASATDESTKVALAAANRQYEEKFGRIFIVCATGKSTTEILSILNARMNNAPAVEWREAAEQQRQITKLRLRRWLGAD
jgi:2-oxo-4-hydroxy-4-carboxy-5-ureidoimidazoline decarboxylase